MKSNERPFDVVMLRMQLASLDAASVKLSAFPSSNHDSVVYAISAPGYLKIGYTTHMRRRILTLQRRQPTQAARRRNAVGRHD